jgi:membrane protease YdiL (CAAX protease family)
VPTVREFLFEFAAWLIVAIFCIVAVFPLWFWARTHGRKLLPSSSPATIPWTDSEMVATFCLIVAALCLVAIISLIVKACLDRLGFFSWLYGPEFSTLITSSDKAHPLEKQRYAHWLTFWTLPFNVAGIVLLFRLGSLLFRMISGAGLPQRGFSINRPAENFALACLIWLGITPVVFAVNFLVDMAYFGLSNSPPEAHPLTQLAQGGTTLMDGLLIALLALVLAPVWEELAFRGVLQPWLCQREWGGHLGMALAFLVALGPAMNWIHEGLLFEAIPLIVGLGPIISFLIMMPGYLHAEWLFRRWITHGNAARGIYATSLLFGMVHYFAWPTPIPLFFLALGLGFLAYRTQSLLASIIFHSLFNAVACIALLFLQFAPEPTNGREATSAGTRPVSAATSTRVPTVWQLR